MTLLTIFEYLLSIGIPAATTYGIAAFVGRRTERFFTALVRDRGALARHPMPFKIGLGLDDMTVGTWDFLPASRALRASLDDPELDRQRRAASTGVSLYFAMAVLGGLEALFVSFILGVNPGPAVLLTLMTWAYCQYFAFRHGLWASRPEIREAQQVGVWAYGTLALVLIALLAIVFGLVGLIVLVRGT